MNNRIKKRMKQLLLIVCFGLVSQMSSAQSYQFAKSINGPWGFTATVDYVDNDKQGNIYYVGTYSEPRDFDPSTSTTFTLAGAYNKGSGFILKLNRNGEFVWAKRLIPTNVNDALYPKKITLDTIGNLYIAGAFFGELNFDPAASVPPLFTSVNGTDGFVAKYDTAGNLIWNKVIENAVSTGGNDVIEGLAVSKDGTSIYATGNFEGTADFNPNAGTTILTSASGKDGFVWKLDASGNMVWVKSIPGVGDQLPKSLDVLLNGEVVIAGTYAGTTAFATGGTMNLSNAGLTDGFVAKYNSSTGGAIWAKQIAGTDADVITTVRADVLSNSIYVLGNWNGTIDLDPSTSTNSFSTSSGTSAINPRDVFLVKLTDAGDFSWKKIHANTNSEMIAADMDIDRNGNIYMTGSFNVEANFGAGNIIVSGNSNQFEGFVSKINSSGTFVWAGRYGGQHQDYASSISVSDSMDINFAGNFNYTPSSIYNNPCNIPEQTTPTLGMGAGNSLVFAQHRQEPPAILSVFSNVVTWNSFYAHGYIHSKGKATTGIVEYGATPALGSQVNLYNNSNATFTFPATTTLGDGYQQITSLQGSTKYYYRIVATNEHGTTYSHIDSVVTLVAPSPIINQLDPNIFGPNVINTTNNSATITNYEVKANNLNTTVTIEYGHTINYGTTLTTTPSTVTGNSFTAVSVNLSGLTVGTYHYRIKATNIAGSSYSLDDSFSISYPLPLTWKSFIAELKDNTTTELTWSTSSEKNTSIFEVEKSTDAKTWTVINQQKAAGNSETVKSYKAIDKEVLFGITYYRIKQIDIDDKYAYSIVLKVYRENDEDIFIYPNPCSMNLTISLNNTSEKSLVEIFTIDGRKVISESIHQMNNSISLATLTKGTYMIRISNAKKTYTSKIVKQ